MKIYYLNYRITYYFFNLSNLFQNAQKKIAIPRILSLFIEHYLFHDVKHLN